MSIYLDRTLPVGGYALENVAEVKTEAGKYVIPMNILWENSTNDKELYDAQQAIFIMENRFLLVSSSTKQ